MRCDRSTKPAGVMMAGLLTGVVFAVFLLPLGTLPLGAEPPLESPPRESQPYYDISKEVTLTGTVSSVLTKAAPGMIVGSHLLLTTAAGEVDASLGKWAMQGKDAFSVTPGRQVEATGVMKTVRDKQVFITRVVKVDGHVFTLRNQHGLPLSPESRERQSQMTVRKGESL